MSEQMLTADGMRSELLRHIRAAHGTQKAAAQHWGVSQAFVSACVTGRKSPSAEMLRELGLCKVVVYAPV